jgi:hypothetical protein
MKFQSPPIFVDVGGERSPDRAVMPSTIRRGKVGECPRHQITPTALGWLSFTGAMGRAAACLVSRAAARNFRMVSGLGPPSGEPAPLPDSWRQVFFPILPPLAAPSERCWRSQPISAPRCPNIQSPKRK